VLELEPAGPEADPGLAPAVPDPDEGRSGDPAASGRAMQAAGRLAAARGARLGRMARAAFAAAFSFVLSVAAWDFVAGLFARHALLGWVGAGLLVAAVLAALGLALREMATLARLARIERLRAQVATAHELPAAQAAVAAVGALYRGRAEMEWPLRRLGERAPEVLDGDALLRLAEAELMAPLDAAARAEVEAAARQVAAVTALVPLALADVAAALVANLAMVRRIAEVYGGRGSPLASWRILRRVAAALVGAGALALGDELIGSVAGGGVMAKVSRRFGEGVVNAALTVRVGVAAMEACRPMPFAALDRPGVSATVSRALAGFLSRADRGEG
jgi:putative membrane protein